MRRQCSAHLPNFVIKRNEIPILQYGVHPDIQVNTGISYSLDYEGGEACIAAGLDLWQWESNLYPPEFMARVVARYRARAIIRLHIEDAKYRKQEGRRRLKGKR